MTDRLQRIHITGGPGAGKTWLADRLAERLSRRVFSLDGHALDLLEKLPRPPDMDELVRLRLAEGARIASEEQWISEGSNVLAAEPFLRRATLIICVDVPWEGGFLSDP